VVIADSVIGTIEMTKNQCQSIFSKHFIVFASQAPGWNHTTHPLAQGFLQLQRWLFWWI